MRRGDVRYWTLLLSYVCRNTHSPIISWFGIYVERVASCSRRAFHFGHLVKGLPPLPASTKQDDDAPSSSKLPSTPKDTADSTRTAKQTGVSLGARATHKRKAPGDDSAPSGSKSDKKDKSDAKNGKTPSSQPKKKAKKESKNLLSFGDD